jgi:UDP-N-acetylglucosamine:LPS N-acetylglucosamine transferase/predicted metal-dependent phosphoesterase TrpH
LKKILIFTAGFGEGHNTAARNVRDALELIGEDDCQVEVLDLFESCYGRFNDFMRKAYLTAINKTPRVWEGIYKILDNSDVVESNLAILARMRRALDDLLRQTQPDVVVSTYPVYNYLLDEIYADGRERHFAQITIVTDSISVNSLWFKSTSSDLFIVPNDDTSEVLKQAGIPGERIRSLGFPVQLAFNDPENRVELPDLSSGGRPRVLYIINSGKSKAPKVVSQLLAHQEWHLTITAGRDAKLQREIAAIIEEEKAGDRVKLLGWTSQMPQLMMSHHVVISKAGGATVQEAIAAACPMIVNQVVPGQEEGNYELLNRHQAGALAEKPKEIVDWLERAFADKATLWSLWKKNISAISRPDSSLQIARYILEEAQPANVPPTSGLTPFRSTGQPIRAGAPSTQSPGKQVLMVDLHTHTTFSDGKLTVSELVDFYGQRGFDCLCVTDHYCDPSQLLGKLVNLSGLVLLPDQVEEYFAVIEKEKKRAWKKYDMILMAGIEFNKDGYTKKSSAHLLGVDLQEPIDPTLDLKETIAAIHAQNALAIASHPHEFKTTWGKDTLYFWENQDEYAPLLDAWEIANRDDIFNPVGLKRLPFIASSDFHKPKHIYSWKTVLFCEKEKEAIKQCIRLNRDISITIYRDHRFAAGRQPVLAEEPSPLVLWPKAQVA